MGFRQVVFPGISPVFLVGICLTVLSGSVACFLLIVHEMIASIYLPCGPFCGSLLHFFLEFFHVTLSGKLPHSDSLIAPLNGIIQMLNWTAISSFMASSLSFW